MNTMMMKMILPFCLITASLFSPAIAADMAEDTTNDKQSPAASEKPLETWPSSAKPEGPLPGACASFLDPGMRLIDRKDSDDAKEEKKDESGKEKETEKKEKKKKKKRANAYTNPESTSCIV